MELSRRGFIKLTGAGLAASSLGALGFGSAGEALAAAVRPFKLTATTETRNTCTYCSVACGIIIYSLGDRAKNARSDIIHIEGDPDHPVNRGTLCPKGSALLDIVHAPTRLKAPKYRAPGSNQFKQVSWDFALDRIATLMKEDRDKTLHRQEQGRDHRQPLDQHRHAGGVRVLQRDRLPDLEGRALAGHGGLRQPGARLTRTDGGQSGPNLRSRRDDQHLAGHQERQCRRCHGRQRRRSASLRLQMGDRSQDREPGAKLVVVDPRFTRTASVADLYAPIRPGTDIAFLSGLIRYLLEKDAIQHEYVRAYTNAGLIVKEGFGFDDGLVQRLRRADPHLRQVELGLRARRAGLRQDRRHAGSTRAASSTCCASTSSATRRRWCRASAARRRTSICRSAN